MFGLNQDGDAVLGLNQERQLLLSGALVYAARYHRASTISSRNRDGSFHITDWIVTEQRVRRLANALLAAGVKQGDRVGTLAWNNHRHLELYFATTAIGAVCHPINPRLFPDQVAYIAGHAEDVAIFYDLEYASLAEIVSGVRPGLLLKVALCGMDEMGHVELAGAVAYEDLLASSSEDHEYQEIDEKSAASLCYTSGTTGNPKGVLSSHRALVLHAMVARTSDLFDLSPSSVACAIVPLYHAHASWGLPFAAAMTGCSLVLPGIQLDGAGLVETINSRSVTVANGVPTVWLGAVTHLQTSAGTLAPLNRIVVAGAAPSPTLLTTLEDQYGIDVCHVWGMTETGPCGTSGAPLAGADPAQSKERKVKQGHGIYGVEQRISNEKHVHCPWGEEHVGALQVRGPFVVSGYFKGEGVGSVNEDGWFNTGDIASIDGQGYLKLLDREKDLVKSGGEWISSIEVENAAMAFPGVREAAVIAIPHERWGERPLLVIVAQDSAAIDETAVLQFLGERLAKWWLPERIVLAAELPKTGTGKVMKTELRRLHALPA